MPKFRKKPVVIEAVEFRHPMGAAATPPWLLDAVLGGLVWSQGGEAPYLTIKTLEGNMRADLGDWIIRGVAGEIYPCKPDIFAKTYEPVEAPDHAG